MHQSPRARRHNPRHHSFRGGQNRSDFQFTSASRGRSSYPPTNRNPQREVHFENASQSSTRSRIPVSRARQTVRPRGLRGGPSRQPVDPETQWFRVEVPHGESCGKEFLFRGINAQLEQPVIPYNYHTDGTSVIFHVIGNEVADSLRSLSRRITKPDGFKIVINAKPCTPPQSQIDETLIQLLRDGMSKRFTPELNYLDLSAFRKDEVFVSRELYVPLDRPAVLKEVVKIIQQNIPNLMILNLAENRIKFLESLSPLTSSCPSLTAINLSKNSIASLTELDRLKGLQLQEVWMQGNPCSNVKDKTAYISAIRSVFPKIVKLDGEVLPAAIGFDVGEEKTVVPQSLQSHIPEVTQSLVHGFLKAFYDIFDSDNRQPLVAAYHDQSSFSLSICKGLDNGPKCYFAADLLHESRNLMRVREGPARTRLLKQGKISVVAALTALPGTHHVRESFLVDVPFFSEQLVVLVINGVLIETWKSAKQLRAFSRNLSIVPQGDGYVITNDLLLLSNSSYEQRTKYRSAFSDNDQMRDDTHAPANDILVTRLRQQTGMNDKFSLQCLSECAFNFEKAVQMFNTLNAAGSIPADAFV